MSGAKVDVRGILERAGADPDAPEGSQAWALAQVDAVVTELIETCNSLLSYRVGEYPRLGYIRDNDVSRAQIDAVATALSNIVPQS